MNLRIAPISTRGRRKDIHIEAMKWSNHHTPGPRYLPSGGMFG